MFVMEFVTSICKGGYLNDNHVTDWIDSLGVSEYSLCAYWSALGNELHHHIKPMSTNLGNPLLWGDLRAGLNVDIFKWYHYHLWLNSIAYLLSLLLRSAQWIDFGYLIWSSAINEGQGGAVDELWGVNSTVLDLAPNSMSFLSVRYKKKQT